MFYFDFSNEINNFLKSYQLFIQIFLWLYIILVGIVMYKKPTWGCFLLILIFPWYLFRAKIFGFPTTFLELSVLIGYGTFLFRGVKKKEIKKTGYQYPLRFPIILFLISGMFAVFIPVNTWAALGLFRAYFLEPIFFFLLLLNVVKDQDDLKTIIWALGLSTLPLVLMAIFQKFTGFGIANPMWVPETTRRVTAFFTSPNAVGLYVAPICAIFSHYVIKLWKQKKMYPEGIFVTVCITLQCAALIFTFSRGSWFALLAAFFFIAFLEWSKKGSIALAIIAVIILLIFSPLKEKIIPFLTFSGPSGQNRLTLWEGTLDFLTESPVNFIVGSGIFGFRNIQEGFSDPFKLEPHIYPHNIILNFWIETGLLGLVSFLFIIYKFFQKGMRDQKINPLEFSTIVLPAMVAVLAHGLIDVPYFKNDLSFLFWTLIAFLYIRIYERAGYSPKRFRESLSG